MNIPNTPNRLTPFPMEKAVTRRRLAKHPSLIIFLFGDSSDFSNVPSLCRVVAVVKNFCLDALFIRAGMDDVWLHCGIWMRRDVKTML
ncbi:hypothetical protein TNIN_67681 [Trichonephila inaurata madagascariensis]|uniref:Uncharacterized protein n=1 Tax=Trichonephila inaurata madagascariensis TaxID=2747483 RepID=A0A8X6MEH8_9ARAC|nr:hypothetical protein TNIN_67681 [Trichonephila inaurata madagascariensis]